jgi:hypothetical protein
VSITVAHNFAVVAPAPLDLLEAELTCSRTFFDNGGPNGHRSRTGRQRLFTFDDQGRALIFPGLAPRFAEILRQWGHEVVVRNDRAPPVRCQRTEQQLLAELQPAERELLAALAGNYSGQVVVRNRRDVLRAIEIVCRWCPEANVMVPVATIERVNELYDGLVGPLDGNIGRARGANWARTSHRMICAHAALTSADYEGIDVVLVTDPQSFFRETMLRTLPFLPGGEFGQVHGAHRRIAILQGEPRLDAETRLYLEGYCGPVVYRVPDPRGQMRPVQVHVCEGPHQAVMEELSALDRKRQTCWHHDRRNALVAQLARAAAAGDVEALWECGVGLHCELELPSPSGNARVIVLVESPEHGRAVQKVLPGWPLIAGTDGQAATTSLSQGCIMTSVAMTEAKRINANWIVVASGGESLSRLPGFPARGHAWGWLQTNGRSPIHVLDIADDFDRAACSESRRRFEAYRACGWSMEIPRYVRIGLERETA